MSSTTSSQEIKSDASLGSGQDESRVCSMPLRTRESNRPHPNDEVCSEPLPAPAEDTAAANTSTVESSLQDKALSATNSGERALIVASGGASLGALASSGSTYDRSRASEVADPAVTVVAPDVPALTSEEEVAIQSVEPKPGKKTCRGRSKRSTSRTKKKKSRVSAMIIEETRDAFDEWVGRRLKAWKDQEAVEPGKGLPPVESGVPEEIDFDPSKDEIEFPTSLSALQRRQVHAWAMQLALFHASSGDDAQRHVMISKTGAFKGKLLTRGGRAWYKQGVTTPYVKRFALLPGYEEEAQPLVDALQRFHGTIQEQESGFAKWLAVHAPGPSDGSDLSRAREVIRAWPLLRDVEWSIVETPEQLASLVTLLESCKEFGFDLEAHNARTYHGLTCLLQISTESKDFIVDPLAEGMWESMTLLRSPFANPDILKVGHSIRSCDVPSLFRDFGIVIVNAIDTEESVHALGDKHTGLAKVLEKSGVKELYDIAGLKQQMQTCDWRERPLSADKLMYARCDSHYLLPLWWFLRARLLGADTFANRKEKEEEEEEDVLALGGECRQFKDYSQDGGRMETLYTEGAGDPASVSLDPAQGDAQGVVGQASPVPMAEDQWTASWENPEHCDMRERSRNGSFSRSDLESIEESATDGGDDSVSGSSFGRRTFRFEGNDIPSMFLEEYDQNNVRGGTGGDDGSLTPFELGENLVDGDESEEEGNYEEDEDEDLWEGWGCEAPVVEGGGETAAAGAGNGETNVEKQTELTSLLIENVLTSATAPEEPSEAAGFDGDVPDLSVSLEADVGGSRNGGKKCKRKKALRITALPNDEHILHTDGILLIWKAFYRTQLAAAVLWHPPLEAKRKDSHKERHFRTAMQRLKPPRWSDVNIRVYEDIYLWRDRTARCMDDGISYVCPGDVLIDIALALPKTLDELRRVSVPLSPVLGKADTAEAEELVRVVRVSLGLPEDEDRSRALR